MFKYLFFLVPLVSLCYVTAFPAYIHMFLINQDKCISNQAYFGYFVSCQEIMVYIFVCSLHGRIQRRIPYSVKNHKLLYVSSEILGPPPPEKPVQLRWSRGSVQTSVKYTDDLRRQDPSRPLTKLSGSAHEGFMAYSLAVTEYNFHMHTQLKRFDILHLVSSYLKVLVKYLHFLV